MTDDKGRHGYLFLLKYGPDGPWVDTCIDMSMAMTMGNYNDLLTAEKVAVRLGCEPDVTLREVMQAVQYVHLRSRMDGACDGPFLVRSPEPLTRDQLELLLQDKRILQRVRNGGRA